MIKGVGIPEIPNHSMIVNFNTKRQNNIPPNHKHHHMTLGEVAETLVHIMATSRINSTCPISINGKGITEIKVMTDGVTIITEV